MVVDAELAEQEAVAVVNALIHDQDLAERIVETLVHDRPDLVQRLTYPPGSRFWFSRTTWKFTPWVLRGGDEYGNDTVAVKVPFGQFVLVTTWPRRKLVEVDVTGIP